MPSFDRGHTYVDGEDATENIFNDPWDALEEFLNVTKLDGLNLQDGIITPAMLTTALQDALGVNGAVTHRGKSIIATEEIRSNTAYGLMPTPDRVQSVAVPADGLLRIGFHALWKNSVAGAGRAAIFIGSNQLEIEDPAGASVVQELGGGANPNYGTVHTFGGGLAGVKASSGDLSTVTTGQVLGDQVNGGGECLVFDLPAGTYDVSVRFKASSGTVSVKQRHLWVEAEG